MIDYSQISDTITNRTNTANKKKIEAPKPRRSKILTNQPGQNQETFAISVVYSSEQKNRRR